MNKTITKNCKHCGLPDTYPGIEFDENTICNYCVYHDLVKDRGVTIRIELKKAFLELIEDVRKQRRQYHAIVAYSGGKDSTFLLQYAKRELGLRVLACTFDNGLLSDTTLQNIRKVTTALSIESRLIKPDFSVLKEAFLYALTGKIPYPKEILAMLSPVCAVCIGMVFGTTLHLATQLKIPLVLVGFNPGQYPAIALENFFKVQSCVFISDRISRDDPEDVLKILADPIRERFGESIGKYFFRSQYVPSNTHIPKVLLPFHALIDYDENEIFTDISKLGWTRPHDTDSCSTNCILNSLGIYAGMKQLGYHPYIGELSYLVREGKLRREEAIKISTHLDEHSPALEFALTKLGLRREDIGALS